MLISFNWLKQYVSLPDSTTPQEVADKLKLSTVEVEKVERQGAQLENIVVGKVLTCEKHPNADKLKVCEVDVGNEKLYIVCGGSNVSEGMLVAVAKVGAKVKWHGEGELVELKPTTIRGVESQGMICASDEIGLGEMFPKKEEKEILDLTRVETRLIASLQPGTPLAVALGLNDTVLEIDNKSLSNRPDLWGHYGIAREVAVLFNRAVSPYQTKPFAPGKALKLKVTVEDAKLCPRYTLVALSGITVAESPAWLEARLKAVGVRPINNIVDITNYIMFDLGQPMHAFDAARITNQKIVVRRASDGEKFVTLDEKEHTLTNEMLVIATDEKAVALAGVMGGAESGITSATTTIIFESANFDAANVRKTSTKLGVRTDSSARFEKSLDPNLCPVALQKAVEMVLQVSPTAKVASKIVDEKNFRLFTGPLEIPVEFFGKKLGVEIPSKTIVSILERLGFGVAEKKGTLSVKIPSWRATKDISIPEDIVEEVARIFGYDNIPVTLPNFPINPPEPNKLRALERLVGETLVKELGYTEVYNYSFVSANQIKATGDNLALYLELDNPISKEKPFLRRHLIANLIENAVQAITTRDRVALFEIGKVYRGEKPGGRAEPKGDELLPRQDTKVNAIFLEKNNPEPFWAARRALEALAAALGVEVVFAGPAAKPLHALMHPGRATWVTLGGEVVGDVFELHPALAQQCGLAERAAVCALNLSALNDLLPAHQKSSAYRAISPYPSVTRDLAFVVKATVTHAEILAALKSADPLLTNVVLFDVYTGSNLTAGYKSLAYHLTFASPERTLTTAEVDAAMKKIEKILATKFSAEVRS